MIVIQFCCVIYEENSTELPIFVNSYAPWCPACKALEEKWKVFAASSPHLGIKVGAVDVTTSPGLSGRFMVTALPTIFQLVSF